MSSSHRARAGRVGESYIEVLWGLMGWKDLYKVKEYSPEKKDDVDKQ